MDEFLSSMFGTQWVVCLVVGVILFVVAEVGYRRGLGLHVAKDEARKGQVGGVQGAVLGLLALLLGFTFSMAVDRYETRRQLVLKEANAVGTTWLRAGLLTEPHRAPVRELLARYVDVRLKFQPRAGDAAALVEGLGLSAQIQSELWKHTEAAAHEAPGPLATSFITALNEMIDTDAERIAAGRNRIPGGVWLLLIIVAAFGCFTSSYGSGAQGARSGFTGVVLPLLITIVIILVFDLSHGQKGVIRTSQQPLVDVRASMDSFAP